MTRNPQPVASRFTRCSATGNYNRRFFRLVEGETCAPSVAVYRADVTSHLERFINLRKNVVENYTETTNDRVVDRRQKKWIHQSGIVKNRSNGNQLAFL